MGLTSSGMQLVTLPVTSSLPALQCALKDAAICAASKPRLGTHRKFHKPSNVVP